MENSLEQIQLSVDGDRKYNLRQNTVNPQQVKGLKLLMQFLPLGRGSSQMTAYDRRHKTFE